MHTVPTTWAIYMCNDHMISLWVRAGSNLKECRFETSCQSVLTLSDHIMTDSSTHSLVIRQLLSTFESFNVFHSLF